MFIVVGMMFGGIIAGYLLRRIKLLQEIGKPISYTIMLLLFLLGLSAGGNREIIDHFPALAGQALLIASAGTLGSLIAAWVVYRYFFKGKKH
jgi:uncharacterized membrane protein YbjE (DUF340 family)